VTAIVSSFLHRRRRNRNTEPPLRDGNTIRGPACRRRSSTARRRGRRVAFRGRSRGRTRPLPGAYATDKLRCWRSRSARCMRSVPVTASVADDARRPARFDRARRRAIRARPRRRVQLWTRYGPRGGRRRRAARGCDRLAPLVAALDRAGTGALGLNDRRDRGDARRARPRSALTSRPTPRATARRTTCSAASRRADLPSMRPCLRSTATRARIARR
jgi:hypothetical protein